MCRTGIIMQVQTCYLQFALAAANATIPGGASRGWQRMREIAHTMGPGVRVM